MDTLNKIRISRLTELIDGFRAKKDFADHMGWSYGYPGQLIKGLRPISEKTARTLEKRFGKPYGWMDTPTGLLDPGIENVHQPNKTATFVPLISWVHAGMLDEAIDQYEPGDAEIWFASHSSHGPGAFALRVVGDSMVSDSPMEQSFHPGCVIIVDPEKPFTTGSKVIAKHVETNKATFKVYQEDGPARYLRPLNKLYPMIEMDHQYTIVGVVIEKIESV